MHVTVNCVKCGQSATYDMNCNRRAIIRWQRGEQSMKEALPNLDQLERDVMLFNRCKYCLMKMHNEIKPDSYVIGANDDRI